MVFGYTMLAIGLSFVVFCLIRLAARPAPSTMNKEWQEATNEYLRVRYSPHHLTDALPNLVVTNERCLGVPSYSQLTVEMFETEPKCRTHHRLVLGRLQRQGPSAEQTETKLTSPGSCTLDILFQFQSLIVSAI